MLAVHQAALSLALSLSLWWQAQLTLTTWRQRQQAAGEAVGCWGAVMNRVQHLSS
jgi:hypothetical protein